MVFLALAATTIAQTANYVELPGNYNNTGACFYEMRVSTECRARLVPGDEPMLQVDPLPSGEFYYCTAECREALCSSEACLR